MKLISEVTETSTPYTELSRAYWTVLNRIGTSATTYDEDMQLIEDAVRIDMQLKQLEQNGKVYVSA